MQDKRRGIAAVMGWVAGVGAAFVLGLALSLIEVPAARAANECGSGTTVTCTSAGNPYGTGLTYNNAGQTLSLETGVAINAGANIGIWLQGGGTQTLNIASGVTITNSGGNDAILIIGSNGSTPVASGIVINAAGTTVTTNGVAAWGYDIWGAGSIQATVGDVTANANAGVPVYITSSGGPVSITTGNVKATGINASGYTVYGVYGTSTGSGTSAGDVTINTTGGTVSLTGTTTGSGIFATSNAAVTVTTAGVEVAGNGLLTAGIWANSFGTGAGAKVTVDSSAGSVAMTGTTQNWAGIFAGGAGGPVEVTTANVSTKAANSTGVQAQSAGAGVNGAVTITTTAGLVKTEGAGAVGISALSSAASGGGLVTVKAGDVTTTGTGAAYGIRATSTSGGVKVTAGTINTAGNGASGVNASAAGAIDVAATKIVTKGDNAYGFSATGTGTADVKVTVGEIQTGINSTGNASTGVGAHGVNATGGGLVDIESTTGSKITTLGKNARGINIDKLNGAATVHAGAIQTSGDNATGIHVYNGTLSGTGTGGAITVTANSVVTTGQTVKGNSNHYEVGNTADGIDVFNIGSGAAGKIIIDTSVGLTTGTLGTVSVSGRKARGIVAVSGVLVNGGGSIGGGAIDITAGTVTTTGDFGTAISAQTYAGGVNGAITITTLGTVSASGANIFYPSGDVENEGNYQPNGISAFSWGGGDVTITTKNVSSAGASAPAITAQSGNGNLNAGLGKVTIDTTGGTVSATGAGSSGISVGSSSGEVKITTANVSTTGDFATAIQAGNTGPNSAMTIDTTAGRITTTGKNATGISVGTGSFATGKSNTGLLKILAGDVEVTGEGASAIGAAAYNGPVDISIIGDVSTGTLGSHGVSVSAGGTTAAKVTVSGSITTVGAAANGILISGPPGLNTDTVIVSGKVDAQGASAYGILLTGIGDQVTVTSTGTVSGGQGGVRLQQLGTATATVTNAGIITGTGGTAVQFAGNAASTFDNSGTVNGSVLLGGGDDTAILRTGSAVTGNVDGEGGTDKLQLAGAGATSLDASKILNFESGEKNEAGTWTLTGTNATFMSTFAVNAGRLAVNGTLANTAFSIADGAVLGGTGTTGAVTVASGGKLAPGNSIGTLNVATATFDAGAIFDVEINATTADKLAVAGLATISSSAQVSVTAAAGTYTNGFRYQILTAGPRSGEFSSTVIENAAFLDFALDQTIADEVWLTVSLVADLPDVAETPNQIAAAGGIQEQGPGAPLFDAIVPLDADSARQAFDLASGEIHATEKGALLDDSRFIREAVLARLDDAFGVAAGGAGADPFAAATTGPAYAAWGHAYGAQAAGQGDGNAAAYARSVGGVLAGFDVGDSGAWRIGAAAGYEAGALAVSDRASEATRDGYNLAAYAAYASGPWALRIGGAYGFNTIRTTRHVQFASFDETLTAQYGARTGQVFGEIGYRTAIGALEIEPFAGLAHVAISTDGFTESGGSAALSSGGEHGSLTLASFGARFSAPLPIAGQDVRLTGLLAWQHAFGDMTPTADLAFASGTPFTVAGPAGKRDRARVDVGLDWQVSRRARLSVGYSGQFASGVSDHAVKATFSFRF